MQPGQVLALLAALSFGPPILYLLWVRARERRNREPVGAVLGLFLYGATLGIGIALFLNGLFGVGLEASEAQTGLDEAFLVVVVGAPFMEELAKGLGLSFARPRLRELEDGIIYGAAIGLGFAATENLAYGARALQEGGLDQALAVLAARVFSSMLLHAGSTALLGFGYGLVVLRHGVALEALPFYLVAVLMHAAYNFLVFTQQLAGFAAAVLLVILLTGYMWRQVRRLDAAPPGGTW